MIQIMEKYTFLSPAIIDINSSLVIKHENCVNSTTENELTEPPTITSTNVTMMENSTTSEYICCLCHYPGTSSENLNAHITNMHAGMLRSNAAELTNSERQSTIEKEPPKNIAEPETTSKYIVDPINCNLCNYSGTSPDDLKAHVEI